MVELASDLLPSLTPPPGYNRVDAAAGSVLNSREEERRRMEEDELREAKAKEKAKLLEEKMVSKIIYTRSHINFKLDWLSSSYYPSDPNLP